MICWWLVLWGLALVQGQFLDPEEISGACPLAKPYSECADASFGALDINGEDCGGYWYDCANCGGADNRWFKANLSCCACGGGVNFSSVSQCHVSAVLNIPVDDICNCAAGSTCFEGDSVGCPMPDGSTHNTNFDVYCEDCHCVAQRTELGGYKTQVCSANYAKQDNTATTLDLIVARGALRQLLSLVSGVMVSVGLVQGLWQTDQKWWNNLLKRSNLLEFSYLQTWGTYFLNALTQNTDMESCSVHLQSTGESIMLKGGGCNDPFNATLVTSVSDNSLTKGYRIVQADDCKQTTAYSFACDWSKAFIDGSSAFNVSVVYVNSAGEWARGYEKHDSANQVWWNEALAATPYEMVLLPGYVSPLDGSPQVGVGVVVEDTWETNERALIKCDLSAYAASKFLKGTVGGGARYFAFDTEFMISASSHGDIVEDSGGPVPNFIHLSNSSDIVVRLVSQPIIDFIGSGALSRQGVVVSSTTLSSELGVKFDIYMTLYGRVFAAYVTAPQCGRGSFMAVRNINEDVERCQPCPAGRVSALGQTVGEVCHRCPPGSYTDGVGSTICLTCTAGSYQDRLGSTGCKECPRYTTSHPGAKNISECECHMGHWSPSNRTGTSCLRCGEGLTCLGGIHRPYALPTFYRISDGVAYACSSGATNPCLGGNVSRPQTSLCQEGYQGVGCSRCAEGFYRFGRDCNRCRMAEDTMRFYYVVLLMSFYFARVIVNSKYKSFYIVFSFLQVFSVQGGFNLGWPASVQHVMRLFAAANLQPDLFVPYCEEQPPITEMYIINMGFPWVFMLMDWIVAVLWTAGQRAWRCMHPEPKLNERGSQVVTAANSSGNLVDIAEITEILHFKKTKADFIRGLASKSLSNMRLMYLLLASKTLDMLFCTPAEGDLSRLSADVNIVCWQGEHMKYLPVVIVAALFYIIGMPLAYICVLYDGYRRNALYSPQHLERFGILYARFEPRYFWWELVILFRRFLTVLIKSAFNVRTAEYQAGGYLGIFQAAAMIFVMGVSLFTHAYARPFCNPYLDFGDAVYLGVTGISCILGICFSAAQTPKESEIFETIFFVNLGVALAATAWLLWLDVEGHHPVAKRFREKIFSKLRVDAVTHGITVRARGVLHRGNTVKFEEHISGVDCSLLQSSPFLTAVMRSALVHSMQEHLASVGVKTPHIEVHMEPLKRKIWYMVELPPGSSPKEVQDAVKAHSHTDATEKLLQSLMRALGRSTSLEPSSYTTSI